MVPPAGLEPAPPAPEAGALSAELRGHVMEPDRIWIRSLTRCTVHLVGAAPLVRMITCSTREHGQDSGRSGCAADEAASVERDMWHSTS